MNVDAAQLPEIEKLRKKCQALAMLDALICPEWEYRYFSFNSRWADGLEMASMRNGQGDDWFLLFSDAGAALKGFAHESEVVAPDFSKRLKEVVPQDFRAFLEEPAFSMDHATFCYWRRATDSSWSSVFGIDKADADIDDGSNDLLTLVMEGAAAYKKYASEYFEFEARIEMIEAVFEHAPLTSALVQAFNSDLDMVEAVEFADEISYPIAGND